MIDILLELSDLQSSGKPLVLAAIVKTAGSSPREAGAKMLVFPDGSISGTIGGGNFEKMVIDDSLGLFKSGNSNIIKKYRFSQTGPDSTGMCCGGEAEVFMELYGKPDRLVIFGGGHIGMALSRIAGDLGFQITIVDDRQKTLDQYQSSIETILTDDNYKQNFPALDNSCYAVIVTRSHKCDKSVLEQALAFDCAYIGMIGSKTKVAKTKGALKDQGFDEGKLNAIRAPIGKDIGAEGPYEIAVSIAAELIAVKRKASE
ncbi:MAG: xanthine dehydrogenase accessory protein XdhC [candidate division Zixibacteria bacterium]